MVVWGRKRTTGFCIFCISSPSFEICDDVLVCPLCPLHSVRHSGFLIGHYHGNTGGAHPAICHTAIGYHPSLCSLPWKCSPLMSMTAPWETLWRSPFRIPSGLKNSSYLEQLGSLKNWGVGSWNPPQGLQIPDQPQLLGRSNVSHYAIVRVLMCTALDPLCSKLPLRSGVYHLFTSLCADGVRPGV